MTKWGRSGKIGKLSARAAATTEHLRKNLEKNLKKFKKGIDKGKRLWYNTKAVARKRDSGMVIENWTTRDKYKAKAKCKSRQRVIYTQQSKRS